MEIIQLEAFDRVARDGTFTRAARSLGLTQPAVSMRISQLEAEIGGELFERRGRELFLTPLGDAFLPYAQRILTLRDDSLQVVKHVQKGLGGQVRLAAPAPFLLGMLVDTLQQFRQSHPRVDILIRDRNKTTIFDLLLDNSLTLGLVNAPVFDSRFTQLARFRDIIVPVTSAGHPLAKREELRMSDLYHFTVYRVSMFPQMTAFIDELAEQARPGSGGAVIALPMLMARRMVLLGRGMTFLPASYVRQPIESGEFTRLHITDMPDLYAEPVLITHQNRDLDDAHRAFADTLRATWQSLLVT